MSGKVCVITGASRGIGHATALALAKQGATVIILCRSHEHGERACLNIARESGYMNIEYIVADLSVMTNVRRVAAEILQGFPQIHVLVNNAAVMVPTRELTVDGIEKMFATNYLSHFLLTNLLLDRLKASAPARIVNVATLIREAKINLDDLMLEKREYSSFGALGSSKLALILFTRELARRLEGTGVTVNALHPGLAKTTILDGQPWPMKKFIHLLSSTPEKASRTSVFLASDPIVEGVTGKYFVKCKQKTIRGEQIDDEKLMKRLWHQSTQLTKLA